MRERSTWNREDVVKKAALLKKADPYTMNQDHPQPAADKYVTGDPSTFAEDVHTPNTWESEYSGDAVKRDEIGLPAFRSDTFNHSEKTAGASPVLVKKADLCIAVARMMLAGKKVATSALESQAYALMFMPDQALIETHKRLANEQQDAGDEDSDEDLSQDKQAQDQEEVQQDQAKQAQQQEPDQEEEKVEEQADKQAAAQPTAKKAAMEQLASEVAQQIQSGNLVEAQAKIAKLIEAQGKVANPQQLQAQIQQLIQQAMGQQVPAQQQAQQPVQQVSDEQVLDQMLAADACGPMAEADIQMEPAPMDVLAMGPEDEMLRQLFAQEEEQEEEVEVEQTQQKQAGQVRTASTRTVGTRPSAGVAKLGGGAGSAGGGADLSSLWKSDPDVRDAFGLK